MYLPTDPAGLSLALTQPPTSGGDVHNARNGLCKWVDHESFTAICEEQDRLVFLQFF
jgi:hypothetical protein